MVEAMGGTTPRVPEKSLRIRTEKIDFVLTQICDITAYPVLIRLQPGHAMADLRLPRGRAPRADTRPSPAAEGEPADTSRQAIGAGVKIGARVKTSRSGWYQTCIMTYHLQKRAKRPLDRKRGKTSSGAWFNRSIAMTGGDISSRNTVSFRVVLRASFILTAIKVAHRTPETP